MHIAIDGRALTGRYTGDRTYWRNLLRVLPALDPTSAFSVYSRLPIAPDELPPFDNLTYRVVPAANDRVWTLLALPATLRQSRPDLLHVQYTIPPHCACPVVTTIHDISFRLHPEWFPPRDRMLLNLTIPFAMRRAARVITDSDSSRNDMLRAYHVAPDRVISIPLGLPPEYALELPLQVDAAANADATIDEEPIYTVAQNSMENAQRRKESAGQVANTKYNLDAPFVLAVGVLQPRKNLRLLARAFGIAKAAHGLPHLLALVGKAGWQTEEQALRQAAFEGGGQAAADAVVFPGYVDDADLPALYRACDAFAYPSLYEGFGLPPLEAMACGAPVLVSDAPPMPHNVGDAALVLAASDVNAWAEGLGHVLTDAALRAGLSGRGPARAALFTWEATARQTLQVYRGVVEAAGAKRV